jgi:ATP-dependent Clp protease ATP-binding subunit ClpC
MMQHACEARGSDAAGAMSDGSDATDSQLGTGRERGDAGVTPAFDGGGDAARAGAAAAAVAEIPLPVEDLTEWVRRSDPAAPSPFAADAAYEAFFDALCRALHRSGPAHAILVRERGVGERAALLELARRGLAADPPFLGSLRVVLADFRRIAPQHARAALGLLAAAATRQDLVLCIDGLSTLLAARGPLECRALTLSILAAAQCRVIGILAPHEYEELVSGDAECRELFEPVPLQEPDGPAALKLARHFADGLEQQYGLTVEDEAVRRAVTLSASFIPHERLPHKAVRVLRAACDDAAYERSQLRAARDRIAEQDVIGKVAQISGIPAQTLCGVGERVDYFDSLRELVVGQDHAVREVATELGLIKAGLVDPGKPASVMLFVGQTGTGKTELAKALARFYSPSKRLKTFTLGNFSEPHSVSGLIGVPAGYVGHEQGGRLVNELNADPYSVFLLDEADKAHPDVMQPFLNLFDEGWVLDQRGVKAYAERAIFILTTNVGQRQVADLCRAGKPIEEITAAMKETLSRIRHTKSNRPVFSPEFLARVKRVIVFRSLDAQAMRGIAGRVVAAMAEGWRSKRQKTLCIDGPLVEAIVARAYAIDQRAQGREGGRVVRKLLADWVESRVQAAIGEDAAAYRAARTVHVTYQPQTDGTASSPDAPAEIRPEEIRVVFGDTPSS